MVLSSIQIIVKRVAIQEIAIRFRHRDTAFRFGLDTVPERVLVWQCLRALDRVALSLFDGQPHPGGRSKMPTPHELPQVEGPRRAIFTGGPVTGKLGNDLQTDRFKTPEQGSPCEKSPAS
jgi:hypothetical protein